MEYTEVDEATAQRVREGQQAGWFSALREGKMIQMDVRPTLSKYQQGLVPDQIMRSRQAHLDNGDGTHTRVFYLWLEPREDRIFDEPPTDEDLPI